MPYNLIPLSLSSLSIPYESTFFSSNFSSISPQSPFMAPEMEKPRVTEIKVRMDCNGCVHKIKKALNGITGIYDIYVDFPQQKISIIGGADPEKLLKAIKKTRKSAVICVHTEQSEQSDQPVQPTEPAPEGEQAPEAEGGAAPPPPPEAPNKQLEPEDESADTTSQSQQPYKPKDHEEVHVIYHHPPDYGYRYSGQWNGYHSGLGFRGEPCHPPQPVYVSHSYSAYKPSPYVTEYAYQTGNQSRKMHLLTGQPERENDSADTTSQSQQPSKPKDLEEVHVIYHHPPDYGYRYTGQWNGYHGGPGFTGEPSHPPQQDYETHSYNTYKPSPYVIEYAYPPSPLRYSFHSTSDSYSHDYNRNYSNGNITSMFSEENPNACRIM